MQLNSLLNEQVFTNTDKKLKTSFMLLRKSRNELESSIVVMRQEYLKRYSELQTQIKRSRGKISPLELQKFTVAYQKTKEGRVELLKSLQQLESSYLSVVDGRSVMAASDVEEKGIVSFEPQVDEE
jgi:hypothetical protein